MFNKDALQKGNTKSVSAYDLKYNHKIRSCQCHTITSPFPPWNMITTNIYLLFCYLLSNLQHRLDVTTYKKYYAQKLRK